MRSKLIVPAFAPEASALRRHFDTVFANPRSTNSERFVWDPWTVPGQYRLLRTPAWEFFPKKTYESFHTRLVQWGRENLGCHDISPPWLSSYVEGCSQNLHGDLPHGPFAFVYSLTPWARRTFKGGETLFASESMLDYWRNFSRFKGLEEGELLESVPPRFNQLLVFDGRIPHGVREVKGCDDVRDSRLVIHGWFVKPRPFFEGPIREKDIGEFLDAVCSALDAAKLGELFGLLSLRFTVSKSGSVTKAQVLANTLRSGGAQHDAATKAARVALKALTNTKTRPQRASSRVTLPLVFE